MPNWDKDYNAGRTLLTMNGLPVFEAPIHLEGGSIHSDGQGTMVVTEECLLDPSRNPDLGKEGIEKVHCCQKWQSPASLPAGPATQPQGVATRPQNTNLSLPPTVTQCLVHQ